MQAMRRWLVLLWIAVLLASLAGPALGEESPGETVTEITDAEGLRAMAENPEGRYRLARDIDLRGEPWVPIAFAGELDGAGHTIYNLYVDQAGPDTRLARDGNKKPYDTAFAGLFSVLENAAVRDLTLKGAFVELEHPGDCLAALLTGYMDRTVLENVTVEGRVHLATHGTMVGVGGLAGYGCGSFKGCTARVELVFEDRNRESKCEQFLGGVLACGICSIEDCTVVIDGYDSCHGYVHNGGLVGMYFHCGTGYKRGPVNRNTISGRITFFEDNRDRRAYCRPGIGEHLSKPTQTKGNNSKGFKKKEVRKYDKVLQPEQCDAPVYELIEVEGAGTEWGWTQHVCTTCGYSWTDRYTAPVPDEASTEE